MRLRDLHPMLEEAGEGAAYLEFDCPAHPGAMLHANVPPGFEGFPDVVRIKIATAPQGLRVWGWNGERDFDKMTVTPSINMFDHWHGFVTNGEVTTC